ncbi:MAG: hypothetical protein ACFB0C_04945 [Leptolyngbyaceae cyanobacterium]
MGAAATVATQTAKTADDWQNVADQWTEAITLLDRLLANDPNHDIARAKAEEYRNNRNAVLEQLLIAREAASSTPAEAIDTYRALITETDQDSLLIADVRLWSLDNNQTTAEIVVTPAFLEQSNALKLEVVTAFAERWAVTVNDAEARVRFVSQSGQLVGGHNSAGVLYVDD